MVALGQNFSQYGPPNHIALNQSPYNLSKQVACRLCDRVLNNTKDLISHIESHIAQGDIAPINQNNQQYYPNNQQNIQPKNSYIFLPNLNLGPRFPLLPSPPSTFPQRAGGATQVVVQRPVPSRGSNLSVTLGGGPSCRAHLVKINLSQPPIGPRPLVSPDHNLGATKSSAGSARQSAAEAGPSDCTRPFLSQLDHPIPKVIDLEMENEDGLDLALTL